MTMTSKERVRAAFEHKVPDRVPCFLKGVDVAYAKLMKHFGVDSYEDVHDRLDIDVWNVWAPYIGPELPVLKTADGQEEFTHEFGYRFIMHWNGAEYNAHTTHYPLQETETIEELDAWTWPNPDHFDYEAVARECEKHENRALRIGWPGVYQFVTNLVDAEKLYIDMATEPEYAQHLFDKMVEFELEYYGRMFEAADGRIDILCVCDDYGTQNGMLFSNDMWNQFFARNTKRLVELAHSHGAYYLQHSCGAVRPIIQNLVDCNVDGLDAETGGVQRLFHTDNQHSLLPIRVRPCRLTWFYDKQLRPVFPRLHSWYHRWSRYASWLLTEQLLCRGQDQNG